MKDNKLDTVSDQLIKTINAPGLHQGLKEGGLKELLKDLSGQEILQVYFQARHHFKRDRIAEALSQLEDLEPLLSEIILDQTQYLSPQERSHLIALELLIGTEFPEAAKGQDKDIPQYFQKRSRGNLTEAKSIYLRLIRKYPDQEVRTTLLRCWRTGSAFFPMVNLEARRQLGDHLAKGIKKTIEDLVTAFSPASGALELMNSLKVALGYLPSYKPQALRILTRLGEYSVALNYHTQEFNSVAKIIADYLGGGLFNRREILLVTPEDFGDEEDPGHKQKIQSIDIRLVQFTPEDLKKILIPTQITGTENQTLAYCRLYWEGINDSVLENKILLYSQTKSTNQYTIFQIISKGRSDGVRDELILYRVYHALSQHSRYEYNIRKDIYMQKIWAKIKPGNEVQNWDGIDKNAYAQEQARLAMDQIALKRETARQDTRKKIEKEKNLRQVADLLLQKKKLIEKTRKDRAAEKSRAAVEAQKAKRREVDKKIAAQNQLNANGFQGSPYNSQKLTPSTPSPKPNKIQSPKGNWQPYKADEILAPRTSILERIKEMETDDQKNLVLVFRRQIESITEEFVSDFAHQIGVALTNYNRSLAVLSIKDFILTNLENPRRNWALSQQRQEVKDLGFNIADIEPIIESCLHELERNLAPLPN